MTENNIKPKEKKFDKEIFKLALKACLPVIFGYLPTGFAFGLMHTAAGYSAITAILMSIVIYAGAGQYITVRFFAENFSFMQMAVMTFLINTKHLFYGLSLLDDYKSAGVKRLYMMFSLTDETYALLTEPNENNTNKNINRGKYCFYVSLIDQSAWVFSTFLGAVLGSLVKFDISGLDFAMTALFIVILINQLKSYKTKIPFVLGTVFAIAAFLIVGKSNMLLLGTSLTVIALIPLRRRINLNDSNR